MLTFSAPRGIFQWVDIYNLYQKAFPAEEKKPFRMILKMYRKGASHVWRFAREGKFAGLIITINGPEHILLDYLAVEESQRGIGIGTVICAAINGPLIGALSKYLLQAYRMEDKFALRNYLMEREDPV